MLTAPSVVLVTAPASRPDRHEAQRADHQQRDRHPPGAGQPQPERGRAEPEEDRHLHQRDRRP